MNIIMLRFLPPKYTFLNGSHGNIDVYVLKCNHVYVYIYIYLNINKLIISFSMCIWSSINSQSHLSNSPRFLNII